jgi:hypothetical protein
VICVKYIIRHILHTCENEEQLEQNRVNVVPYVIIITQFPVAVCILDVSSSCRLVSSMRPTRAGQRPFSARTLSVSILWLLTIAYYMQLFNI